MTDNKDDETTLGADGIQTGDYVYNPIKAFKNKKPLPTPDPMEGVLNIAKRDIYGFLDETVSGQETAKQGLASIGHLFNMKCKLLEIGTPQDDMPRLNIFMSGPTGYGKTYMLTELAKVLNVPIVRIDCSSITQEGWAGASISEMIVASDLRYHLHSHRAGIIILDELDKLAGGAVASNGALPHTGTQHNLLDLLDSRFKTNPKEGGSESLDRLINNSLIVCAGSFEALRKKESEKKNTIGFTKHEDKVEHSELDMEEWKLKMVEAGLIPELVGRVVHVIELQRLTEEQILEVFHKHNNVYDKYRYIAPKFRLENKELAEIAKECYNSKHGLRQLDSSIFKRLLKHLDESENVKPKESEK